ncbi:MAG: ATP-binding protein [Clostridia bacterium]|nr:ATP-binding protein [Clostridia bacterium]
MESTQALEKIVEEYENLRAENARKREISVQEVYAKLPEIKEIDDKMYSLGQNTLREILANPEKTGLKEELHKKYQVLKQTRKEILEKNNVPLDFDKVKYRCEKCQDTGYIEGVGRCSCFNQRVLDCMYEQSKMQELFKTQNFEMFRLDYYSEKVYDKYGKTPRKQMEEIKAFCEKYADNFESAKKSLCFYGDTGLGKTFMSSCIAKRLIDNGFTVLYIRASKLFRLLEDEKFGRNEESVKELYDCDMLVVDDLGTEPDGKNNAAYILELINERIMNNKKVIINTNLNFAGMEKKYTKRFSSRLIESFNVLVFFGEDIRQKVK